MLPCLLRVCLAARLCCGVKDPSIGWLCWLSFPVRFYFPPFLAVCTGSSVLELWGFFKTKSAGRLSSGRPNNPFPFPFAFERNGWRKQKGRILKINPAAAPASLLAGVCIKPVRDRFTKTYQTLNDDCFKSALACVDRSGADRKKGTPLRDAAPRSHAAAFQSIITTINKFIPNCFCCVVWALFPYSLFC